MVEGEKKTAALEQKGNDGQPYGAININIL